MQKKVFLDELSGKSIMVLLELIQQAPNPVNPRTLAKKLFTARSTISGNLKRLLENEYITEIPNITCSPADLRQRYFIISKKGMEFLTYLYNSLFPYYKRDTLEDYPEKAIKYFNLIQLQITGKNCDY